MIAIEGFGKGMVQATGAGLAFALFDHLADLPDAQRPKVVGSTQHPELFGVGLLGAHPRVWLGRMGVGVAAGDETSRVGSPHKLADARAREFRATVDTEMDGFDNGVLRYAKNAIDLAVRGEELEVAYTATLLEEQTGETEEGNAY